MVRFLSRVALLSFGGAYAVLPYVAQAAVEPFGWRSGCPGARWPGPGGNDAQGLDLGGGLRGLHGGWSTSADSRGKAVAATVVTVWFAYLPWFGFILVGAPVVEASRNDLRFSAPPSATTAALVSVIASLAVFFAAPVLWSSGAFKPAAALWWWRRLWWPCCSGAGVCCR